MNLSAFTLPVKLLHSRVIYL